MKAIAPNLIQYRIDEKYPPKHTLTPREEAFLQGLAEYRLFLDKSLFFQINDLQRHTKLVLSGKRIPHDKFPDPEETERDLRAVEALMKEYESKQDRDELTQEDSLLLDTLKAQHQVLQETSANPVYGKESKDYLGEYRDRGDNSKVVLYVDAIEEEAKKNPYDTMLLMGQVLLHEYFHSFYFHAGDGGSTPIRCVEELMVEYGSLVLLDSVAASEAAIAKDAGNALRYAVDIIKKKQSFLGTSAAYGFGAYLYEKHREEYRSMMAEYANISGMLDDCEISWLEFKYMLYPKYPTSPTVEDFVYGRLREYI